MRGGLGSTSFGGSPAICFMAHRNGVDQSSVSSTATALMTVADFNVGNYFSTASGDFTPPAGVYEIGFTWGVATGLNSPFQMGAHIAVDGVGSKKDVRLHGGSSVTLSASVTMLVKSTGTSTYTPQVFVGGTATCTLDGNTQRSFFWAKEVTR